MDNKFKALVNFQAASLEQVKLIAIIQCPIAIILANSMLSRVAKIFLVYSLKNSWYKHQWETRSVDDLSFIQIQDKMGNKSMSVDSSKTTQ